MPDSFLRKTRILVITPYAGRTGSELMISHLIRHASRERFEFALCSLQPGELLAELPTDVPGFVAPHRFSLLQKLQHRLGENPIFRYLRTVQRRFRADVWYLNTLVPGFVIPLAKELGVKVVSHLHELPMEFVGIREGEFNTLLTESDLLIGCADIVCQRLREAGAKRVVRCYELIDHRQIRVDAVRVEELRAKLGIRSGEFVWAMAGQSTYRKGFDVIPDLSEALQGENARLLWLGQLLPDGLTHYVRQRLTGGSGARVDLTGPQRDDYFNYLTLADGFVLTSREDPFPLVMIEAAALGKPIVSFPSGGVAEFVLPGMGQVVNSWNLPDLVSAMRAVSDGSLPCQPDASRQRAAQFDVSTILPTWEALMAGV
jgi:glycosyltransferase involved in cell wall biosynthesis